MKCNKHHNDIACQDGDCPDCNYREYLSWLDKHRHCDVASWECPDENDCPHKRLVAWVVTVD